MNPTSPRLTIEEINAFNPSPENPLEVECDDGHFRRCFKRIKITGFRDASIVTLVDADGDKGILAEVDLVHYPSIKDRLGFCEGDEVSAYGVAGVVKKAAYPNVFVEFENGENELFWPDGKRKYWHKTPSLRLIKRPMKKVKKVFHLYSTKEGTLCDLLLDEQGNTPSGKHGDFVANMVKIPGTEVVLEVEVKS